MRNRTVAYRTQFHGRGGAGCMPRVILSAACIARNVIPRVRPPVCCVQCAALGGVMPSIPICTQSLHAIIGRFVPPQKRSEGPERKIVGFRSVFTILTVRFRTVGPSDPTMALTKQPGS